MTAPSNRNTQGLPPARLDDGNQVTETVFLRRQYGEDRVSSSKQAVADSAQYAQDTRHITIPPSHQPGAIMPNQSPAIGRRRRARS